MFDKFFCSIQNINRTILNYVNYIDYILYVDVKNVLLFGLSYQTTVIYQQL